MSTTRQTVFKIITICYTPIMAIEAPFNTEEATKKWQKKLDKDSVVNLFLMSQDILRIQLGPQWQSENLKLQAEDFDTYFLRYVHGESNRDHIYITAKYSDNQEEVFNLARTISSKGKSRYVTYVWEPPRYYRTPGGVKLTEGRFTKTFLDWDPTQTMASRLWYAHLYTLGEINQVLEPLKISELPKYITN